MVYTEGVRWNGPLIQEIPAVLETLRGWHKNWEVLMQAQSITPRTVTAASGMILPATITPETDMNLMVTAICLYHSFNERRTDYATLEEVMMAMRDGSAVVTLYRDVKGEQAARVLWPNSITLSAENNITCKAYCTLRRQVKSFRIDRMAMCHALTTPDDCEAAA